MVFNFEHMSIVNGPHGTLTNNDIVPYLISFWLVFQLEIIHSIKHYLHETGRENASREGELGQLEVC